MNITQEQHINIGGEKRLLKFGTNATAVYCDERDVSLSEFQNITWDKIKPGELRDIIWSGLVAGQRKQGNVPDFDQWDVGEWIDELSEEEIQDIFEIIQGPTPEKKQKAAAQQQSGSKS